MGAAAAPARVRALPTPLPLEHGIVLDFFAGGGGASAGIRAALGRCPDAAVNHDPEAIAMHAANHPGTLHYCEDVFAADPATVMADVVRARPSAAGQPVLLAWMSPDCTHFSKARGGKPVSRKRRGLAWLAVRWAAAVRPLVILIENVEEFFTWGPLDAGARPDPKREGVYFLMWRKRLEKLGYTVDWQESRACDYGAPTTRKRLCVQARCDGRPIRWPRPTHAAPAIIGRAPRSDQHDTGDLFARAGLGDTRQPWRTAAEIIDWSIPCPSIFARPRPLKPATCRRVATGIRRYVLDSPRPFLIRVSNAGGRDAAVLDLADPLPTITTARGGELALVAPTLVAAFMAQHNGGVIGHPMDRPLSTLTLGGCQQQLVAASLINLKSGCTGAALTDPLPTLTAHPHAGLVSAFMVAYYGTEKDGQPLTEPLRAIPTRDRFGLVTTVIDGTTYAITDIGMRMLTPRELASGQGFPPDYILAAPTADGKGLGRTAQVARIGNSVSKPWAAAHVRAALYLE